MRKGKHQLGKAASMTPYVIRLLMGFLVPLFPFLAGILGKKIASRDWKHWECKDWYWGVEVALVAVTACALNAADLDRLARKWSYTRAANIADAQLSRQSQGDKDSIIVSEVYRVDDENFRNTVLGAASFVAFLLVCVIHQKWQGEPDGGAKRFWLGFVANGIGYAMLVCYMLVAKGLG
jgi:hypothetical protein